MASLKSVAKDGPTMLLFGRLNNFMAWKTERLNRKLQRIRFLANLKTNEPYVPDPVQPADNMPAAADEGDEQLPALGAAAIAALRLDAEKLRNKAISKLKDDAPKLKRFGKHCRWNRKKKSDSTKITKRRTWPKILTPYGQSSWKPTRQRFTVLDQRCESLKSLHSRRNSTPSDKSPT